MLQKHMKDQDHQLDQKEQEQALKNTFQAMGQIVDILIEKDLNSIRECLIGKVYTVKEEDFGEEAEFVKTSEILSSFNIQDQNGFILKALGEYMNMDLLIQIIDKLGFDEDMPESKKHLNYQALNL